MKTSVTSILNEAELLGAELAALRADRTRWRLSRQAWTKACLELGGFADIGELEAARGKIATLPNLARVCALTAEGWARAPIVQPTLAEIVDDHAREQLAYVEKLVSGLTTAQISGVVSLMVSERREWSEGGCSSLDEGPAEERRLLTALAELDAKFASTARLGDVQFSPGRALVTVSTRTVDLCAVGPARVATTLAELVAAGS